MQNVESLVSSFTPVESRIELSNAKQGMKGTRLLTRKEYREKFSLGRAESEVKHNAYLRENGVKANKNIAAQIAGGEILILGIKEYAKTGKGQLAFIRADKVVETAVSAPVSMAEKVATMTAEDKAMLLALLQTPATEVPATEAK